MPRASSSDSSLRRLIRAALFGLLLGCAIGGVALLGVGAVRWLSAPDCPQGEGACVLERELAGDIGMRQVGVGAGLTLLAVGLWLLRGERAS